MEKIKKRRYDLAGKIIYRESSDCSTWELTKYDEFHGWYEAKNLDDDSETVFTPSDLIDDYVR